MNNNTFTCLTVLTMLLLADGLCILQTMEFGGASTSWLLTVEGTAAGAIMASGIQLLRKRFARQKKPVSRRPIAAAVQA